jgi:hypothetical protein
MNFGLSTQRLKTPFVIIMSTDAVDTVEGEGGEASLDSQFDISRGLLHECLPCLRYKTIMKLCRRGLRGGSLDVGIVHNPT